MAHSIGGFFNELDFLTNIPILNNDDNRDSIFNEYRGEFSYDENGNIIENDTNRNTTRTVVYKSKDVQGTEKIKNYIKDKVHSGNNTDLNIYLKLIKDFEQKSYEGLRLAAGDFAYLKNLGVYPINRLWCLRRFTEGTSVPHNLLDWGEGITPPFAMSTIVGWIDPEKEEFYNMTFNEEWTVITDRLDEVMSKIMQQEFDMKSEAFLSLPGWSQGLLFAFLKEMGLTDYSLSNIPQGNPNVLQEAATRAKDANADFGLKSDLTMTLETEYEQKFIGDIDPGSAMLDLIHRLIYMGTSDVEYVFGGSDPKGILSSLKTASISGSIADWWNFIVSIVEAFISAITTFTKEITVFFGSDGKDTGDDTTAKDSDGTGVLGKIKGAFVGGATGFVQTILASTVMKWKWALVGSVALMTGENSTPWHLTLGNPYSPVISLGNIKVTKVEIKSNNEFGFNDIPTRLKAIISISVGRNLGAQEIFRMFNMGYTRVYDTATGDAVLAKDAVATQSISTTTAQPTV